MSTITIELPDSVRRQIENLALKEGYTPAQFIASAAGEKLAVTMSLDYLKQEAEAGQREDFEQFLAAVPDAPPQPGDELPA